MIDESIFREYDIRGIVPSQINEQSIKLISRAIAQKCNDENIDELALGRDGRLSGEKILNLLSKELQSIGIDVVNIGIVTSPLLYFAAKKLPSKSGIMITGSHNPKNYNGFKIVINDVPISGLEILSLLSDKPINETNIGKEVYNKDTKDEYIQEVLSHSSKQPKKIKVVLDCGNGSAGEIAPKLIRALGYEVIELFCEIDGNFPNHHPDPGKVENLQDLVQAVQENSADVGIAFDGDGDRLGVVTEKGEIIFQEVSQRAKIGICALVLGCCEEALTMTAQHVSEREQFGRPLSTNQGVALQAADAHIDIDGIRVTQLQAAWEIDEGLECSKAVSSAKWWASEAGQRIVVTTQHLHGGTGADTTHPIHRYFLWVIQLADTLGGAGKSLNALGKLIAEEALNKNI